MQAMPSAPPADVLQVLAQRHVKVSKEMDRSRQVQIELARLREVALGLVQPQAAPKE